MSAPAAEDGIDVGILGRRQNNADDTANDDAAAAIDEGGNDGEENAERSSRRDVLRALNSASYRGSFSGGGRADGPVALPFTPGLRIKGVGEVTLPLSPSQIRRIKSRAAWRVDDESYRGAYQVEPHQVRATNPAWDAALKSLARTSAFQLGLDPKDVTAKLDRESLIAFREGRT